MLDVLEARHSERISRECLNRALDEIDALREFQKDWLAGEWSVVGKRYLEGEVCIGLFVNAVLPPAPDYVAIFQVKDLRAKKLSLADACERAAKVGNAGRISDRHNGAVFIENVEAVESPKGVAIPSSVWLYPPDHCLDLWTNKLKELDGLRIGEVIFPFYREVNFGEFVFGNRRLCELDNEGGGERVQCRNAVVGNIANEGTEGWRDFLTANQAEELIAGVRVVLGDDGCWTFTVERPDCVYKVLKVFACSV